MAGRQLNRNIEQSLDRASFCFVLGVLLAPDPFHFWVALVAWFLSPFSVLEGSGLPMSWHIQAAQLQATPVWK
jgi:hypothetical protein